MMERFDYGPHIKALEDIEHREVIRKSGTFQTLAARPDPGGLHMPDDFEIPEILRKAYEPESTVNEIDDVFEQTPLEDTGPFVYEFGDHKTTIWPLFTRREAVSVVKAFLPKGCLYPVHKHGEVEMIVIYEGCAIYRSKTLLEQDISHRTLKTGECVRVTPGTPHEFEATADTWIIAVTIPNSLALPVRQCRSCSELIVDMNKGGQDAP